MRIDHNSRLLQDRSPFGAVEIGTTVTLCAHLRETNPNDWTVELRTWKDGTGETLYPMSQDPADNSRFTVQLPCPSTGIVWYSFIATDRNGATYRCGAPQGHTGGNGQTYDYVEVPSFQLTVYKHRETRPSWYEKGMVYQIFPDRYARDPQWKERTQEQTEKPRNGIKRQLVEDWSKPPVYTRAADGSIESWDFYGGSLKGIQDDLPRLHELGFTAIYLNPIFEAASNHRYDTANYMNVDPILGTEKDFTELCQAADELGISIILDGVFNHTGDDSVYFNRYGNYPGIGAWQSEASPWRSAFTFHEDGSYDCWWGIDNMPAINENSSLVRDRILGEDGVIRHWLRAGARGWRLDVADELSDEFISEIKRATLEEKPDALLLGEVWEDASNKISYGKLRSYLEGDELDAAMNYPFRDMVIGFLMGSKNAYDAAEDIETLVENYPREALACSLNLLGSHDKPRIISVLGGAPLDDSIPEQERGTYRLSSDAMGKAKGRFWLATLMQMTMIGVPSIYYGDEFGLEGLSDPGNRRTLPTPDMPRDLDMQTIIKNAAALRRALPFMVDGDMRVFALNNDVLAYTRTDSATGEAATVIINRSDSESHSVTVPALGEAASDVVSGHELKIDRGNVTINLYPFGSSIIYFHAKQRLQQPMEPGAGVLCHITSVPDDNNRPGTLGTDTKRFIDHISDMGFRYWQMLPVNPTDFFRSPYAGPSAFAGNIDLLPQTDLELKADFKAWQSQGGESADPLYVAFKHRNEDWLGQYCTFMACKKLQRGVPRQDWPSEFSRYQPSLENDPLLTQEIAYQSYLQYRFDLAWCDMMNYAHQKGVKIIGDIPMYVSDDSADTWAFPELFNLSDTGKALEISGAPPDDFAPEGQTWGNPTYRWDVMKETGYSWWLSRLQRAFQLYDYVRLDHFLGFHSYYSIPAGHPCSDGRWLPGPGQELFKAAYDELGPLHFIAEDLGYLTPGVRALCATCGFPGMDVLEFSDYDIRNGIAPTAGKILYTSTHDTSTFVGYLEKSFTGGNEDEAKALARDLMEKSLRSEANVVMIPLQDVLLLDDEARMNTPGVATGNWTWQAAEKDVQTAMNKMREVLAETHRISL